MAPGAGAGVIRKRRIMNTEPYPQICRVWPCSLPNDPEWAPRSRPFAGLIQNDGQIPQLFTSPVAGRVSHQNLSILNTPEDNEVPAGGKVALGHNGDYQLPVTQGIQDTLRF